MVKSMAAIQGEDFSFEFPWVQIDIADLLKIRKTLLEIPRHRSRMGSAPSLGNDESALMDEIAVA